MQAQRRRWTVNVGAQPSPNAREATTVWLLPPPSNWPPSRPAPPQPPPPAHTNEPPAFGTAPPQRFPRKPGEAQCSGDNGGYWSVSGTTIPREENECPLNSRRSHTAPPTKKKVARKKKAIEERSHHCCTREIINEDGQPLCRTHTATIEQVFCPLSQMHTPRRYPSPFFNRTPPFPPSSAPPTPPTTTPVSPAPSLSSPSSRRSLSQHQQQKERMRAGEDPLISSRSATKWREKTDRIQKESLASSDKGFRFYVEVSLKSRSSPRASNSTVNITGNTSSKEEEKQDESKSVEAHLHMPSLNDIYSANLSVPNIQHKSQQRAPSTVGEVSTSARLSDVFSPSPGLERSDQPLGGDHYVSCADNFDTENPKETTEQTTNEVCEEHQGRENGSELFIESKSSNPPTKIYSHTSFRYLPPTVSEPPGHGTVCEEPATHAKRPTSAPQSRCPPLLQPTPPRSPTSSFAQGSYCPSSNALTAPSDDSTKTWVAEALPWSVTLRLERARAALRKQEEFFSRTPPGSGIRSLVSAYGALYQARQRAEGVARALDAFRGKIYEATWASRDVQRPVPPRAKTLVHEMTYGLTDVEKDVRDLALACYSAQLKMVSLPVPPVQETVWSPKNQVPEVNLFSDEVFDIDAVTKYLDEIVEVLNPTTK